MKIPAALFALGLASLIHPAFAAPVELPQYGFKIEPLDAAAPSETTVTALATFLPPSDGFAPNINVQIQPYAGTIKDYAELSKGQFDQFKLRVLASEFKGDREWAAEYEGPLQGTLLHVYARAISKDGKIYLVTATATPAQWAVVGARLKKHVDSFATK